MRMLPSTLSSLALLSFGLVACSSDPPPPSEVRSRLSTDLGHVAHESIAASNATSSAPGSTSLDVIDRLLGNSLGGGSGLAARLAVPHLAAGLSTRVHASLDGGSDSTADSDADQLIATLNDRLFTDANYLGDGVYQVPADLVCSTTTVDPNGNPTTTIDPGCAASLMLAQLRVRVEEDGDTLRFAIQLDADHDEPLIFTLTHDSIAITLDLDGAGHAMAALAPLFGTQAPNARLAGQLTGKLAVLGTAHAQLSLTIDRAIDVAFADQGIALDGPDAVRLTSAAAHVASFELDGNAQSATEELGLGATTIHAPGTDGFDLDLPGVTSKVEVAAGQPLKLTHIGLGDRTTTLSKNGAVALAIDLNPSDGRALDAMITGDATTGLETLTVSPRLDLQVAVDHAALGDTRQVYDVTRVLLDGSLRGADGSDQVEVVSGSLAITTDPASYGFSASAGQCVTGTDTLDSASGYYYTQWTVGACQ